MIVVISFKLLAKPLLSFAQLLLPGRTASAFVVTPRATGRFPSFESRHGSYLALTWAERDSNSHDRSRHILSVVRLPIPPSARG